MGDGKRAATRLHTSARRHPPATEAIDPHALDGTAQHDAFVMKLDLSHAAIGARVVRR
jgi:hypothetical protein